MLNNYSKLNTWFDTTSKKNYILKTIISYETIS